MEVSREQYGASDARPARVAQNTSAAVSPSNSRSLCKGFAREWRDVRLLLWKNFLQKRRALWSTMAELVVPCLLVLLASTILSAMPNSSSRVPTHMNIQKSMTIPAPYMLPWILQKAEMKLALAPDTKYTRNLLQTFDGMYPGSKALNIPPFSNVTKFFSSNAEINDYCASPMYNRSSANAPIYAALVVNSKDRDHSGLTSDLILRINTTTSMDGNAPLLEELLGMRDDIHYLRQVYIDPDRVVQAPSSLTMQQIAQAAVNELATTKKVVADRTNKSEIVCTSILQVMETSRIYWSDFFPGSTKDPKIDCIDRYKNHDGADFDRLLTTPFEPDTLNEYPFPAHLSYSNPMSGTGINYLLYMWLFLLTRLVSGMVVEKETKLRESLLMIGLAQSSCILSWVITYLIISIFIVIFATVKLADLLAVEWTLLFTLLLSFAISVFSFGVLQSTIFDRSKTATVMSAVLFIFLLVPRILFNVSLSWDSVPPIITAIISLTPLCVPSVFQQGFSSMLLLSSDIERHVEWKDLFRTLSSEVLIKDRTEIQFITVGAMLANFWACTGLYLILGWYLDHVLPKEYGVRYHWYFPFQRTYWMGVGTQAGEASSSRQREGFHLVPTAPFDGDSDSDDDGGDSVREKLSESQLQQLKIDQCIRIEKLSKRFSNGKLAVDDVSLNIFEGEIFGLLGANGAGKTTTLSMLTGMIPVSSGNAFLYGHSLTENMQHIRDILGVCPQHDCLFENLTVEEHIKLFAKLKLPVGEKTSPANIQTIVDEILAEVGLLEKKFSMATRLSGGQKRKLSLAMALVGDSKVILLDEPTSGMDVYTRKLTWNLLLKKKEGRILILTTHAMDEADVLSNRIAIMAHGKVKCVGSPMFLKSRYGVGYNLILSMEDKDGHHGANGRVIELVKEFVPDVVTLSNVASEAVLRLPKASAVCFEELFGMLQMRGSELGVRSFNISVTTIEEVFLKVAEGQYDQDEDEVRKQNLMEAERDQKSAQEKILLNSTPQPPSCLLLTQIVAVFFKRFRLMVRDRRGLLSTFVWPMIFLWLVFYMISKDLSGNSLSNIRQTIPASPQSSQFGVLYGFTGQLSEEERGRISRYMGQVEKYWSAENLVVVPISPPNTSALTPFGSRREIAEYLLVSERRILGIISKDQPTVPGSQAAIFFSNSSRTGNPIAEVFSLPIDSFSKGKARQRQARVTLLQLASEVNYLLRNEEFPPSADGKHSVVFDGSLPTTYNDKTSMQEIMGFALVIMVLNSLSTYMASVSVHIVKDVEDGTKELQYLMGTKIAAYWVGNFLLDLAVFSLMSVVIWVYIVWFNVSVLLVHSHILAAVLCFLLYGIAGTWVMYSLSFLFSSHSSSQTYIQYFNLTQTILVPVAYALSVVPSLNRVVDSYSLWLELILPTYTFGRSLLNLVLMDQMTLRQMSLEPDAMIESFKGTTSNKFIVMKPSAFSYDVTGRYIRALLVCAGLFTLFTLGMDTLSNMPSFKARLQAIKDALWRKRHANMLHDRDTEQPADMDEDVVREKNRVLAPGFVDASPRGTQVKPNIVEVRDLRKVYFSLHEAKEAVKPLTFGLQKGECFGFLGMNGAGKSTTMKMLTGSVCPTSGEGFLNKHNILTQQIEARQYMGYCPQENALFSMLTTREHLEYFGKLKGISRARLHLVVQQLIADLSLEEVENVVSKSLSGGNKRRLCAAIALVANPTIIFLDEPSSGVDPVSRRKVWRKLQAISESGECCLVLTTHSMEEAEAVCTLNTIMVNGELKCWGTISHLQHKFGNGLIAEFKLNLPALDAVRAQVLGACGRSIERDSTSCLTYQEVSHCCNTLGKPGRMAEFSSSGSAAVLHSSLMDAGQVLVDDFCSWWVLQEACSGLDAFLTKSLDGKVNPIEHHGNYVKYELFFGAWVESKGSFLSKVFGLIERNKSKLGIVEYTISQPSLDQIFNQIASEQEVLQEG